MPHKVLTTLLTLLLGTFLAACSSDSVVDTLAQQAEAIGFNTVSDNISKSRSNDEINSGNIKDQHFRVWGYTIKSDGSGHTDAIYNDNGDMADIDISYSSSQDKWIYTDGKGFHWPSGNTKLAFFAFCPSVDGLKITDNYYTGLPGRYGTKLHYNAVDNTTNLPRNLDLMYAYAQDQTNKNDDGSVIKGKLVPLQFGHLLSQLVFKMRIESPKVRIMVKSIKLCNVYTAMWCALDFTSNSHRWQDDGNEHQVSDYQLTFNKEYGDSIVFTDTITRDLTTETPIFVIPQSTTAAGFSVGNVPAKGWDKGLFLEIEGTLTLAGHKMFDSDQDGPLYVPFNTATPEDKWKPHTKYVYSIHLGGGYNKEGEQILQPISIALQSVDEFNYNQW